MFHYNPKNQLKVDGKMSTEDAGIVAKKLANAALIFATGCAIALILYGAHFLI